MKLIAAILLTACAAFSQTNVLVDMRTLSGDFYRFVHVQTVTTNEVRFSYLNTNNSVRTLETVSLTNLDQSWQKGIANLKLGQSWVLKNGGVCFTNGSTIYQGALVMSYDENRLVISYSAINGAPAIGNASINFDTLSPELQDYYYGGRVRKQQERSDNDDAQRRWAELQLTISQAQAEWREEERKERIVQAQEGSAFAAQQQADAARIAALHPPAAPTVNVINQNMNLNQTKVVIKDRY